MDSLCSGSLLEAPTPSAKLPIELIDIFEIKRNWRESNKSLIRPKEAEAKQLYARVRK